MPPDNEEQSSLERVRQRLYDPQAHVAFEEPRLREEAIERPQGWTKLQAAQSAQHEKKHLSGAARFFFISLAFFVLAAGGAGAYLLYGGNSVSTNNVNVTVQGPTSISSGDVVPLLVTVENKNPSTIQAVTVTIEFPDGTKDPADPTKTMTLYTENLGDLAAGGHIERPIRAQVFGSEGQHLSLPVKIEYHTSGSNAVFVKTKQYDFIVTTSPIGLTVNTLSQVSSGQTVSVDVIAKSNATAPLENVAVMATYPFGFTPSSATPTPTAGTLFTLGTLAPGEEKHIHVTGVLSGQNNDVRIFSFSAGTLASGTPTVLATSYTTKEADIQLTSPFLATTLSVNGDTSDTPVVASGVPAQVVVSWVNTLPTPIANARITVALSGEGLDPATVSSHGGFYNSSTGTIQFDSTTNPTLANLQPGDSGQGTFSFSTLKSSLLTGARNPSVTMQVSIAGQRLSETNVPETISSTLSRTVKVGTQFALSSHIVRTTGPFANTGPWPPEANKETTYTVLYTLTNTGNTVAGASVTAVLPSYVRFTGMVSPSDGSVTYNEANRTVTWSAGDVASGAGTIKTAAFQIGLTPSIDQQGTSPILLLTQQVTGVDRFTQRTITGSVGALNTQATSDPGYSVLDGNVK